MEIDDEENSTEQGQPLNERITSSVDTEFYLIYRKLPVKTAVTIRLFERNEYYTCHGDDALFIARELLHSSNALKYWKTSGKSSERRRTFAPTEALPDPNQPLETIYISNKQFEDILRKLLLVKQYRVEVWKKPQKTTNDWTLTYHVGVPMGLSIEGSVSSPRDPRAISLNSKIFSFPPRPSPRTPPVSSRVN